jgi:hypothetical protein
MIEYALNLALPSLSATTGDASCPAKPWASGILVLQRPLSQPCYNTVTIWQWLYTWSQLIWHEVLKFQSIIKVHVRFEVFRVVTMKNAVSWDIKPSLYLTGDALRLHYRAQPVNVMKDLRIPRRWLWRMLSSGVLRRLALVTTDVSSHRDRLLVAGNVPTSPILVAVLRNVGS